MASCLGIYLNEEIVKYAKLNIDNNKNIKLEMYGVRYIKGDKKDMVNSIIEETNSKDIPVVINPQESIYVNIQIYNQIQNKGFIADVAKMEFEAWCEKNTKTMENYSYVYKVSDVQGSEGKHTGILNIIEKKYIDEYSNIKDVKIANMLPARLLIDRLVPADETNYILVNLDSEMSIETILNSKLVELKSFQVGMKRILREVQEKKGSFAKAYEACKQLNVFAELQSSNNDRTVELVVEPILQEILREVSIIVNKNRKEITKVFITGDGVVFTNIDILFREYLDIKCEILKPSFILDTSNVRNVAEMLETTQAMALAYESLDPINRTLDYIKTNNNIKGKFSDFFKSKAANTNIKEPIKMPKIKLNINLEKIFTGVMCATIVLGVTLVSYILFSTIYVANVNKMIKQADQNVKTIGTKTSEVNSDMKYITTNIEEYKNINTQVQDVLEQVESNKIGKFSTYNFATFLQSIIKIIPKNVQLNTISSDDNKKIKIVAQSSSYSDLGYFVAQLKLQGTLNDVKINNIKNGDTTVIEIGGDLP